MYYERFIAKRYLKSRRVSRSLSIITVIAVSGVAIGVAALIITLSIMNGFEKDLKDALIGASAHLTIEKIFGTINQQEIDKNILPQLNGLSEINFAAPFLFKQALLVGKTKSSGALVRGVDVEYELKNSSLLLSLRPSLNNLLDKDNKGYEILQTLEQQTKITVTDQLTQKSTSQILENIILGSSLAKSLGLDAGDVVQLIPPEGRISPFGTLPRSKKFFITAIYHSGLSGYDEALALVSIKNSQIIFQEDGYSGIAIYLKSTEDVESFKSILTTKFSFPFYIRSWIDDNQNLFAVIKLEKYALAIILTLIILVAAFNIISSLIMLVQEKKRDIAVLKAIGAKDYAIMRIFLMQGTFVGTIGTMIGFFIGIGVCLLLDNFEVISIPAGVYVKNKIPLSIDWLQIIMVLAVSLVICLLMTIIPSKQAVQTNTLDGLRYE